LTLWYAEPTFAKARTAPGGPYKYVIKLEASPRGALLAHTVRGIGSESIVSDEQLLVYRRDDATGEVSVADTYDHVAQAGDLSDATWNGEEIAWSGGRVGSQGVFAHKLHDAEEHRLRDTGTLTAKPLVSSGTALFAFIATKPEREHGVIVHEGAEVVNVTGGVADKVTIDSMPSRAVGDARGLAWSSRGDNRSTVTYWSRTP
jgi:hypothetical protein